MMNTPASQIEVTPHDAPRGDAPSPLLAAGGQLTQAGWARRPLLDCNLENARFYRLRALQRLRLKRWDYYGVTTPDRFFSVTLADLGYAGQALRALRAWDALAYGNVTVSNQP